MKSSVRSHVMNKRFLLSKAEAAQFDLSWKVPAILYYARRNYHTKYDLRSTFQGHHLTAQRLKLTSRLIHRLFLCCLSQLKTPSTRACC